jgi:uncharacterized repeat protein (TIGR04138 family)
MAFLVRKPGSPEDDMVADTRNSGSYRQEAYDFLLAALESTRRELGREGHVTGGELLAGIEKHAAALYGPMAAMVFAAWGVSSGGDFGSMVYELVDKGVLFKEDEDRIEDFLGGESYRRIFEQEYFARSRS